MNSFNVANRLVRHHSDVLPAHVASQKLAKSLVSNSSHLFSTTLNELETQENASDSSRQAVAIQPTRHNLVTPVSNSSTSAPPAPPPPADAGSIPPAPASGSASPAPMTKEQARQILATGQGDVVTANQVYYGTPGAPSQTTSPTATPAGPPTGYAPGQALSADPNVFTASSYIEGLNLSTYQQQANAENTRRYDNYLNQFKNWQMNGSQGQPPAAPQYETVDLAGFQKWWTQYQANIASGNGSAPDTGMFLANAPMYGNGYFGFPGTSQVGTLYNPTGPPTPAQLQAAQSAQNGNLNS